MTDQQLFDPHASDRTAGPGADGAPQRLIVEADGGSRGNPGHAGYGALVRDPDTGRILVEKAAYIGKASNNVAEYSGLVSGLELAREINPEASVHVKMDSKLVVEQMSGRWQIKHADMRVLAGKARTVMNPRQVTYEWIPRERNKDADRLSNEAMDAGMAGVPWKPRAAEKEAVPVAAPAETPRPAGQLHHVEVWTADLPSAVSSLGWLLERLGFPRREEWKHGVSYGSETFYIVLESGPDVTGSVHERRRPGVNHLAFRAGSRADVDLLARRAVSHGWSLMFRDAHPYAGGPEHYAAYLENAEGFEIELVAS
ncbi:reverse transcriptase-like protein [Arthrobacter agilis]|uniref:reverse transcriptase-like protein n=1 Tax=Arthrobacter agilis TaxID=37921 RepID=UPI000B355832|nr:reverse transcriptase-like protein [Arthrobacter agilis]OUM44785.1 ribonuclease HI [Arthrobacter agilis]PPB47109.1 ribonuclease HI [Arthrobacter agilis]TPV22524.1 reverse transcriptase-like protein [Arthrobacter agilis]VDR32346.1 bifunctional RNase H/acid phosphatase [Arthrobacter agilis]